MDGEETRGEKRTAQERSERVFMVLILLYEYEYENESEYEYKYKRFI